MWTHKKFDIGYNGQHIVDVNLTSEVKVKLDATSKIKLSYEVALFAFRSCYRNDLLDNTNYTIFYDNILQILQLLNLWFWYLSSTLSGIFSSVWNVMLEYIWKHIFELCIFWGQAFYFANMPHLIWSFDIYFQVKWQPSTIMFADRFDKYLDPNFFQHRVSLFVFERGELCLISTQGELCLLIFFSLFKWNLF